VKNTPPSYQKWGESALSLPKGSIWYPFFSEQWFQSNPDAASLYPGYLHLSLGLNHVKVTKNIEGHQLINGYPHSRVWRSGCNWTLLVKNTPPSYQKWGTNYLVSIFSEQWFQSNPDATSLYPGYLHLSLGLNHVKVTKNIEGHQLINGYPHARVWRSGFNWTLLVKKYTTVILEVSFWRKLSGIHW